MIDYYNAFISYKHSPNDIKVAENVQKSLEHFHIPYSIRKKTGKKKIERIFRDKDELPITSDLTDTISNALQKADFLIVICSPNSKKSVWVKREIQFFLQHHPKNRVLTVLAEGEPEDVIPEELLTEDKEFENEIGVKYTVKVPVEPLSCDYRMPLAKARKEELPRLAAAIIGCSYDELVRRQRQYKMQRMGIVLSALLAGAVAFGGYMVYSKARLDKAYRESLANQSRFLANESEKLLEKDMRIDALHLALAALPEDEDDERPVIPEAVRALTYATLAYQSQDGLTINSAWDYSLADRVKTFKTSPDGKFLAAIDVNDNVRMWNTIDHQLVSEFKVIGERGMEFINNDLLLLWDDKNATAYKTSDGASAWTCNVGDRALDSEEIMFVTEDSFLLATHEPSLLLINIADGSIKNEYALPEKNGDEFVSYSRFVISPDKTKVGFSCYIGIFDMANGVCDLRTGQVKFSPVSAGYVSSIIWADDNHFVTACNDLEGSSSSRLGEIYVLTDDLTVITCYNPTTMSTIWTQEFISNGLSLHQEFVNLPANNTVMFYAGLNASTYNITDGKKEYCWTACESIVAANDRDGDGWPNLFLTGGAIAYPAPALGNNVLRATYVLTDNIEKLYVNNGIYAVKRNGFDILYFNTGVCDDEWTATDENTIYKYAYDYYMSDDIIAIINYSDEEYKLTITNPNTAETVDSVILPRESEGSSSRSYHILGNDKDNIYIAYTGVGSEGIIILDRDDLSIDDHQLADTYLAVELFATMDNGMICYYDKEGYKENYIRVLDTKNDDDFRVAIDVDEDKNFVPVLAPYYWDEYQYAYVATEMADYIINTDKSSCVEVDLPESWNKTCRVSAFKDSESGEIRFVISDGSKLLILDKKGKTKLEISCSGMTPLGFVLNPENAKELIVPYNDGSLIRYDITTGEFIAKSEISAFVNSAPEASFEFDMENRLMYISLGTLTDMVDLDTFLEYAFVSNCIGHHTSTDRFYTIAYTDGSTGRLGYFRHYTLEELVDKANKILRGAEMSAETRSQYGL